MGWLRACVVALLAIASVGCDDEVPAVVQVGPTHGGTMIHAGPYALEVEAHSSGEIYVYAPPSVVDPGGAVLTLDVSTATGRRPTPLRFDPRDGRYEVRVPRDTVLAGPTYVTYVVGGISYVGFVSVIIVAPPVVVVVDHGRRRGKFRHR